MNLAQGIENCAWNKLGLRKFFQYSVGPI